MKHLMKFALIVSLLEAESLLHHKKEKSICFGFFPHML